MAQIQVLNNGETLHNIRTKINDNFASIDDVHLSNTGKLTNCVLEEPKMVDISVSGGYLTLKKDSVVIVPNGLDSGSIPKYTLQVINNDLTSLVETSAGNKYCFWIPSNGIGKCVDCYSGPTQPTGVREYSIWYDSVNNLVKRYANNTWTSGFSLPFVLATYDSSFNITNTEVYQSIGYIGTHVWVNRGVKCLIPNGLNSDGTLKNITSQTSSILMAAANSDTRTIALNQNGRVDICRDYLTDYELPSASNRYSLYYNEQTNTTKINSTGSSWQDISVTPIVEVLVENGTITYFNPKRTIRLNQTANATTFGLVRTASATDEIDCQCDDAAITPQNLYELEDYRLANTAYALDDTVNCPYHANYMLVCTQAGTTSSQALDTHSVTVNQEITDGTVKWKVKNTIGNREYFTENDWQYSSSSAKQVLELATIRPVIAIYKQKNDGTYTLVTNVDVDIAQNEVQTLKVITKFTGFVMTV